MTGFGIARGTAGRSHVFIETRSVNHRFIEVSLRFPGKYSSLEGDIQRKIRELFSRGKFDLFLKEEMASRDDAELDQSRKAFHVLKKIKQELQLSGEITLSDLLTYRTLTGVSSSREDIETLRGPLLNLVGEALQHLRKMREREGLRLKKWLQSELKKLKSLLKYVQTHSKQHGHDRHRKVVERLQRANMPEDRAIQEAAIAVEKADVTEEIVRLQSHLKEFEKYLQDKNPVGRKFDFLIQEMGREINTIGSKSFGVEISHRVIEFKSELEKVREQIQNVE